MVNGTLVKAFFMPILSIFTIQLESSAFCQWQNFYWIQILDFWKLKCLFIDFDLNPNILLVNLKILMRIYLLKLRPHSAYRGYDSKLEWHLQLEVHGYTWACSTWQTWRKSQCRFAGRRIQEWKLPSQLKLPHPSPAGARGLSRWVCRITGSWKRKSSDTYIWLIFRVIVVIFGMICEICVGIFKNAGMETNLGRGPAPRTRKMLFCQGFEQFFSESLTNSTVYRWIHACWSLLGARTHPIPIPVVSNPCSSKFSTLAMGPGLIA